MSHQCCFLQFGFSAAEHKALLWQWRATGLDGRIVMAPSTIPTTRNAQPQAPSFQHMCKQFKRFELFFQLEQVKRNGWVWWTMWLRSLVSKPPELKKNHAAQTEAFHWHSDFSKAPEWSNVVLLPSFDWSNVLEENWQSCLASNS